eukprot:SAG11_NODE_9837_length_877_cov_0.903599_2_plen_120_part_00
MSARSLCGGGAPLRAVVANCWAQTELCAAYAGTQNHGLVETTFHERAFEYKVEGAPIEVRADIHPDSEKTGTTLEVGRTITAMGEPGRQEKNIQKNIYTCTWYPGTKKKNGYLGPRPAS